MVMVLTRHITIFRGIAIFIFQLGGGIVGALVARSLLTPAGIERGNLSVTQLAPGVQLVEGVFIEFVFTFLLLLIIFRSISPDQKTPLTYFGPLAVGTVIGIVIFMVGPLTGGSLNPARSFGPAVARNFWVDHWVYWVGPFGAGLVFFIFFEIFELNVEKTKKRLKPSLPIL